MFSVWTQADKNFFLYHMSLQALESICRLTSITFISMSNFLSLITNY